VSQAYLPCIIRLALILLALLVLSVTLGVWPDVVTKYVDAALVLSSWVRSGTSSGDSVPPKRAAKLGTEEGLHIGMPAVDAAVVIRAVVVAVVVVVVVKVIGVVAAATVTASCLTRGWRWTVGTAPGASLSLQKFACSMRGCSYIRCMGYQR
jgi:hypothetical protein